MKNSFMLTTTIFAILTLASCDASDIRIRQSGKMESESRQIESFDKIDAARGVTVEVTKSPRYTAEVIADENVINYIITEVRNDCLYVYLQRGVSVAGGDIKGVIRVSCPDLSSVSASESADVDIKDTFSGTSMMIDVSSSAELTGYVSYDKLTVNASSSADVELFGDCNSLDINASSSVDIETDMLKSVNVSVDASSSADVTLPTTAEIYKISASSSADIEALSVKCKNIVAHASSSAKIKLSGTSTDCTLSGSSSGKIEGDWLEATNAYANAESSGEVSIIVTEKLNANASSSGLIKYYGNPKSITKETSGGGSVIKGNR